MTDSGAGESVASAPGEGLPEGWVRARIGDLCDVNPRAFDEEPGDDDLISQVPMAFVEAESGRMDASTQVRFGDFKKKSLTRFQEDDVLFAKITPCMENGKIAKAKGLIGGRALGSTELHVLRSAGGVLPEYLMHYLLQRNVRRVAEQHMAGAVGQRRVPRSYLVGMEIPVPPLPEQRRIVAKLDEQLAHIEAGEASLREVERLADEFSRALLREAFSGRLVADDFSEGKAEDLVSGEARSSSEAWDTPDSWIWSRLGSLFRVSVGSTPSRGNPDFWSGDIPWVSSGEVSFKRIGETREFISIDSISKPENRIHPPGTVMLAMIGEGKTRGQSAILDIPAAHNQNCASIRVSETEILPEFIYQFLVSRYEETRTSASGGNQPALNKAKVERILVPVPPLGTQRRIVDKLADLEQERAALRAVLAESDEQASALRGALLNAAFTGVLVPQDPTDEPASALLDRIRAQRQATVKPARKRALRKTTSKPASSGQEELSL
ncbi:restriction endonuclease subunit S [Streptomyces sp. NBC_00090]|uniref:restriction endonuclease subunit S n=1 Tax=Streptomyces sp. NBC_00090 TaxID=2903619 RepID=UPI0032558FDD